MAMPLKAVAQDTIFGVFPNYYYNWYEYWEHGIVHEGVGSCIIEGDQYGRPTVMAFSNTSNVPGFDCRVDKNVQEIAVEMHPDSTLNVVGISIPVDSSVIKAHWCRFNGESYPAIRTVIIPENITIHLNVYNKNMSLIYTQAKCLADIRDTTRFIEHGLDFYPVDYHPLLHYPYFVPHYDFFFDTTLVLTDTFYISETMTCNDDTTLIYPSIHKMLEVHGWGGFNRLLPWEKRMYRETLDDTIWQEEDYGWHVTCLFPIIVRDGDTCPQVRDVQYFKGSSTQFFLRWGRGANHYDWQVSYGPAGMNPDDGTMLTYGQPQTSLITVDPDSHYVAYVRARCRFARDEWGPWSDSVSIWLNNPAGILDATANTLTVTPNPTDGTVTIGAEGIREVWCVAADGRRTQLVMKNGHVSLKDYPAGLYVLEIQTDEGLFSAKVVKQ